MSEIVKIDLEGWGYDQLYIKKEDGTLVPVIEEKDGPNDN